MPTRRQQRLNQLLREELTLLLPGRLDDPRLEQVIVTAVETTQDMTTAKVYVTDGGEDEVATTEMMKALEHAQGQLRTELGALGLPRIPKLVFARDKQFESGERVLQILEQLHIESPDEADVPEDSAGAGGPSDA